jgi:sodium/bile acid cotransporter 7
MKSFFIQRWFLILLVVVLVVGIRQAESLESIAAQAWLRDSIVAAVMFCMSLPLEARSMWQSLLKPGPPLLAFAINFGLLPLFAWSLSDLLRGDLGPGLLVAATTPCTLVSASVWTRRAGGNDAVSTLVTILTNATCFFVTPMWLVVMTGQTAAVENSDLGFAKMTTQLGLLVVLPITVAQLFRLQPLLAQLATRRKSELGVVTQFGILSMVLFGAIKTGLNLKEQANATSSVDFGIMLIVVTLLHVAMLAAGVTLAKLFRFSRADQIAVAFSGSQKTLMVGVLIAITLKVSILPMVAYHCLQLFIDTLVADAYRKGDEQANQAKDAGRKVSPG